MSTPADAAQFKLGMRHLAGAVNIITSLHGGKPHGMTATAVCSASAEPPTVLVCINQSTGKETFRLFGSKASSPGQNTINLRKL